MYYNYIFNYKIVSNNTASNIQFRGKRRGKKLVGYIIFELYRYRMRDYYYLTL